MFRDLNAKERYNLIKKLYIKDIEENLMLDINFNDYYENEFIDTEFIISKLNVIQYRNCDMMTWTILDNLINIKY